MGQFGMAAGATWAPGPFWGGIGMETGAIWAPEPLERDRNGSTGPGAGLELPHRAWGNWNGRTDTGPRVLGPVDRAQDPGTVDRDQWTGPMGGPVIWFGCLTKKD